MKAEQEVTPLQLVECFEGHPRHRLTALWLDSVTNPEKFDSRIPKPDLGDVTSFLIDIKLHTPPEYFELAASLVQQVPPSSATQAERDAYRALLFYLRQGWYRDGLAALVSFGDRSSRWNLVRWMTKPAGEAQDIEAESPEVEK